MTEDTTDSKECDKGYQLAESMPTKFMGRKKPGEGNHSVGLESKALTGPENVAGIPSIPIKTGYTQEELDNPNLSWVGGERLNREGNVKDNCVAWQALKPGNPSKR